MDFKNVLGMKLNISFTFTFSLTCFSKYLDITEKLKLVITKYLKKTRYFYLYTYVEIVRWFEKQTYNFHTFILNKKYLNTSSSDVNFWYEWNIKTSV